MFRDLVHGGYDTLKVSAQMAHSIVRLSHDKLHTSAMRVRIAQVTEKKNCCYVWFSPCESWWFRSVFPSRIAENYPGFPPPQDSLSVSSMEVKNKT